MIQRIISLLDENALSVSQVGGKAAALAKMAQTAYPVPPGICMSTAVFQQAIRPFQNSIQTLLNNHDDLTETANQIANLLANLTVPSKAMSELEGELAKIIIDDTAVAVRSSATAEDRADASFAGQYESYLGLRETTAVEQAILNCWRSFYSVNALSNQAEAGGFSQKDGMAVLIQPMIAAECAGVCFTLDPVAQQHGRIVINSAWGLGPGVVDGSVQTDTDWVTWNRSGFEIEQRQILEKLEQISLTNDGRLQTTAVPQDRQRAACLPEKWLLCLAQFAVSLDSFFGCPQDIEWAVADGRFWILQSRPITALPPELTKTPPFPVNWTPVDDGRSLWRLLLYSRKEQPPLPLEHDYIALMESIREETCLYLGADRNEEMQVINGRGYSRSIPLNLPDADMRLRQTAIEDLKDRLQKQGLTTWDYWGPELIKAVERLRQFDINTLDGTSLADHLEAAQAVFRIGCSIHPRTSFKPRQPYFDAFTAVSNISGSEAEARAYQLLDNEETHFTRLIDGLYELALIARQETAVANLITNPPSDVIAQLEELPQATNFLTKLNDFLNSYGERLGEGYGSEITICQPTWREEPALVLQLIAPFLEPQIEAPTLLRKRARQQRDAQVEAYCEACVDATAVAEFRSQLAYVRKSMAVLEEHNHTIEQGCGGQLRRAIMAAANWLSHQQAIKQPDDIFWFTFSEIAMALRTQPPTSLTAVIQERQTQHQAWATFFPPPILGIPEAALESRSSFTDDVTSINDDDVIQGIGASPGQVHGRARLMHDLYTLPPDLVQGDILIAPNIGPMWTPVFPILGGLVLDSGSIGQHAAATAREYGVTAVVATGNATKLIPDGVQVLVDGENGRVYIL